MELLQRAENMTGSYAIGESLAIEQGFAFERQAHALFVEGFLRMQKPAF